MRKNTFEINCPFCNGKSVSDVIDSIEEVNGQWECENGHQFVVQYVGYFPLWQNNKECPQCGKPINPKIKSCETGALYCSNECAEKHVRENMPEGGY